MMVRWPMPAVRHVSSVRDSGHRISIESADEDKAKWKHDRIGDWIGYLML